MLVLIRKNRSYGIVHRKDNIYNVDAAKISATGDKYFVYFKRPTMFEIVYSCPELFSSIKVEKASIVILNKNKKTLLL